MYNDYYLQQIDNKLQILQTMQTNQQTIISNQNNIKTMITTMITLNATILVAIALIIIDNFIERCLKC